jgi:hypothetical protein
MDDFGVERLEWGVAGYQLSHAQKFLARIKRKIYETVDRTRNDRSHDKDMLAGRY